MRVLITGVTGFVGGHLADFLRRELRSAELVGLARPRGGLMVPLGVSLVDADLDDAGSVEAAVERTRPDRILHLAGQSSVHLSWQDPAGTLRANLHGALHLLEAARRRAPGARILIVGSAEEYGVAGTGTPLDEAAPLGPASPYAVSKMAQGFLAAEYARRFGLHVVRTRTFPHTGRGRGELFAESSFARQIAEAEAGLRPPVVEVGNLDAVRDFSHVRDVVAAYWALVEEGERGEVYNVCSGRGVRLRELLDELLGLARIPLEVRLDPARLRPSDVPALVGDPSRLRRSTGWSPRHTLAEALRDLLEAWRARVGAGEGEARR